MTYRINAGAIPADSWIQDPEIGGGRIIGEVCHFVDFLTYLNGSLPETIFASALTDPQHMNDVVNVSLTYRNGSIGSIDYLANGDKSLPKERVEVFANGCSAVLDDFKTLSVYAHGRKRDTKLINQDKGQKVQVQSFINAILTGSEAPIELAEIYSATLTTFKILESIRTGSVLNLQ
ncbi:MAG: Gfo/Idh/MocA family oxidoreductase [Desulfosarcina sp.]